MLSQGFQTRIKGYEKSIFGTVSNSRHLSKHFQIRFSPKTKAFKFIMKFLLVLSFALVALFAMVSGAAVGEQDDLETAQQFYGGYGGYGGRRGFGGGYGGYGGGFGGGYGGGYGRGFGGGYGGYGGYGRR